MTNDQARDSHPSGKTPEEQPTRQPYTKPELEDLGTVTELTQAVTGTSSDGGPIGQSGSQL